MDEDTARLIKSIALSKSSACVRRDRTIRAIDNSIAKSGSLIERVAQIIGTPDPEVILT
jgi:hypothetical protein